MPARKPVFVRQLDAARQAQIAVVCEILTELGFIVDRAVDVDPSIIADCVIRGVDVEGVIHEIEEAHDESVEASVKMPVREVQRQEEELPSCPRCGGGMAVRTVKSGPRAGSQFYGCVDYPACRGTRAIEA